MECGYRLPKGHGAKFCNSVCLQANLDKYWKRPYSKRKRWYGPVPELPIKRAYVRHDLKDVEADLQKLEQLLIEDNVNFE
jgi:hypothetical protein